MTKICQRVKARFNPKRYDDLKSETLEWVGKSGIFTASWVIEGGQFEGQWAWQPPYGWDFAWCPTEDLEIEHPSDL